MKKIGFLILMLLAAVNLSAQIKNIFQKDTLTARYDPAEVVDSVYGITLYQPFIVPLGGDSVRNTNGYSCQGFKEDFYTNGQLMHRGYYVNGQLSFFKNFYPDGTVEREYKSIDVFRGRLITYFPDGKTKSDGMYKEGNTLKYQEFFENGNLFLSEELNKTLEYYLESRSYYENGNPSSLMIMVNPKKLQYDKSEYFESGQLKEKGPLFYSKSLMDYVKTDTWVEYDESGKLIREVEFENGVPVRQKSF